MGKQTKTIVWMLFSAYIALMLWLLFGQRWGLNGAGSYTQRLMENLNLVPFRTIAQYLRTLSSENGFLVRHAVINLAGNVVMFVPLGFFLPLVAKPCREYRKHLAWVLMILLAIELLQLFSLLGSCDVDDFILNVPGTAIGFGIFQIFPGKKIGKCS